MKRREFFERIIRNTVLASAILGSSYLLLRESNNSVEECNIGGVCKNCDRLNSCELPEAKKNSTKYDVQSTIYKVRYTKSKKMNYET